MYVVEHLGKHYWWWCKFWSDQWSLKKLNMIFSSCKLVIRRTSIQLWWIFSVSTSVIISFQLMMLVDYAGSIFPAIAHVPWNGLHLADFVMPFFLFVAGISVAIVYKVTFSVLFDFSYWRNDDVIGIWFSLLEVWSLSYFGSIWKAIVVLNMQKVSNRVDATWNALLRALKLFLLGVFLQGIIITLILDLTVSCDVRLLVCVIWLDISMKKTQIKKRYNSLLFSIKVIA